MNITVHVRQKPDRTNLLLYFINPLTGKEQSKSAGTPDRREAERAAARWEHELRSGLMPASVDWEGFRQRLETEHLAGLSGKTRLSYGTALNHFERTIGTPRDLAAVNASTVSRFTGELRKAGMPESSIATHLTNLRASLRWAASLGMIPVAPTIKVPGLSKRTLCRGRPLTEHEFNSMLAVVESVVGEKYALEWKRLLKGLWLGGFRLGEALRLSWSSSPARVDLDSGRFPRIIWHAEGHKSRRDEVTPLTPDFASFLTRTPSSKRDGPVFTPELPTRNVSTTQASRTIAEIGRAAEIEVGEDGRHATAHDLRRSFGTRWAMKVRPMTLKAMMRHRSIETTLKYYVDLSCDDVGAELWGQLAVPAFVPNSDSEPVESVTKAPQKPRGKTKRCVVAT